jgi:phosphate transport system substrate-binding protein
MFNIDRLSKILHPSRGLGFALVAVAGVVSGMAYSFAGGPELSGSVKADGSSTVAPITMAAAEMFQGKFPNVRVTVGISGTGGGFKKFLDDQPALRTDISDASRPIKEAELSRAEKLNVAFIEVPIAIDGLSVVVHPSNSFCDQLTVEELKRIWEPGSKIKNWKDVRAGFPDFPMKLYGPGTDSGTFDYFTEVIVGKEKASRSDYTASESDNVLVQGVAGDKGSLGYFGHSYWQENKSKLKLVAVDNGDGKPIAPTTTDVIRSGVYKPLSRPLFLYVNAESYKRPEVRAFLDFYFEHAKEIVEHPRVGYVGLSDELYKMGMQRLASGTTGSAMNAAPKGVSDLSVIYKTR